MRPTLRLYQTIAKENIKDLFRQGFRRVLLRSEVGSGKTVIFSDLAYDLASKGTPTMIVCNRQKLVRQSARTLEKYGLKPYILMQSKTPPPGTKLIVASADTLRTREFPDWIRMVIIDECHLASFNKILDQCIARKTSVFDASATPIPNKTNLLHQYYEKIITTKPTYKHIEDGELVMDIYVKTKETPDMAGAKTQKTAYGYDYSSKDVFAAFNKPRIYSGVVNNYLKYAKFKRCVCFCASVEHSKKTAEAFRSQGISAIHLDGSDPEEVREKIQADFEAGMYYVLCNCAIYTFGWDCPSVEVVIVNRATASYELWRQMIGRGARPFGDKAFFLVIDHGGNKDRHGGLVDEVDWTLDPPELKKNKKVGVAPSKLCVNKDCECIIPVQSTICPLCKTPQPQKNKGKEAEGEFVLEIPVHSSSSKTAVWPKRENYPDSEAYIRACIEHAKEKKYHANSAIHHIAGSCQTEGEKLAMLTLYSKVKHYKQGWVQRQISNR